MNDTLSELHSALAEASNQLGEYDSALPEGRSVALLQRRLQVEQLDHLIDQCLTIVAKWEREDERAFEERT